MFSTLAIACPPQVRGNLTEHEIQKCVQSLTKPDVSLIATAAWFDECLKLNSLDEQMLAEDMGLVPKLTANIIHKNNKESAAELIYMSVSMQIWRQQVLPELLAMVPSISCPGFVPYSICYSLLYSEPVVLHVLEKLFIHGNCGMSSKILMALGEFALDIIDYCVANIIHVMHDATKIPGTIKGINGQPVLENIKNDLKHFEFILCEYSLQILAAFGAMQPVQPLNQSAAVRMYSTHDVPIILAKALLSKPWQRKTAGGWECYDSVTSTWIPERNQILKMESRLWFGISVLLMNAQAREYYDFTPARREVLLQLRDVELPEDSNTRDLGLLKFLDSLEMTDYVRTYRPPVIVETVAPITSKLLSNQMKWKKLAEVHKSLLFNMDHFLAVAPKTMKMCSPRTFAEPKSAEDSEPCTICGVRGPVMKCARCKNVWYCSKKCQKKDWPKHKPQCTLKQ